VLWFGTHEGGISSYNLESKKITTYKHDVAIPSSLSSNRIRFLIEDSGQNIWIGTNGSGLDLLRKSDIPKGKFTHFEYDLADSTKLPSGKVNQILEDSNSNIWVATDRGLCSYIDSTSSFMRYQFDGQQYLAAALVEDDNGNLWISTSPGLIKFDPQKNTFRKYGKEDGVQSGEFSRYCVTKTRKGELAFGGERGFNIFYPDSIRDNMHEPEVYITGLKIFNKPVEIGGKDGILPIDISLLNEITLSHEQSVFTLDYKGINFTSPEKNSFAYRLEGLENEWNYVDNRRSSTYTNLDPGDYVFHVKAANNHDVWNEKGRSLRIHVLPPWWKTWWAMTLWVLLIVGSFSAYFFIRVWSLKAQRQKLKILVSQRTEELNRQSQELKKINEELKAYDQMVSHDLKGPIGNVNMLVGILMNDKTSKVSDENLQVMNQILKASKSAVELIDEILSFAAADKPETLEKEVDLKKQVNKAISAHSLTIESLEASVTIKDLNLHISGVSIKIYQLFYNLIGNALKFQDKTRKPDIRIYSRKLTDKMEIVVEDNGIGFDNTLAGDIFKPFIRNSQGIKYAGHGIGLGTCQRIVDYHGWTIRAESELGKGSKFIITM
jgi:signal transduction histidine kinase